jgi:predicted transport protein
MKTKTALPDHEPENPVDLSAALLLKDGKLEPQPVKHSHPVEQKFKTEKEFIGLTVNNSKLLFGERTLLLDATKSPLVCYLLLDFSGDFRFYLVDISHSKQNFWSLFERITRLFTFLNQPDYPSMLIEVLEAIFEENKALRKEFDALSERSELSEQLFLSKPYILVLTDMEKPELIQVSMTYSANWGKYVKTMLIKKYEDDGILYCHISPLFEDIDFNGKQEKVITEKKEKTTEADHLENASDAVQAIYQKIKTELLSEDASIEFNPKQYYISMRKNKNLAFFHIKKKLISLVVINSEEDARKHILHHEVKTLTEKVQKFWNVPACTIVIEKEDKLEEVINLLKRIAKT